MSDKDPCSSKRRFSPSTAKEPGPDNKRARIRQALSWDVYRLFPHERTADEDAESDAFRKECQLAGLEYWTPARIMTGAVHFRLDRRSP
jgi:hypothetical protein